MKDKKSKVGRPSKEVRKLIPSMISMDNIWRLGKLAEKYNKDNKKSTISRSDIINDACKYLLDMEDIPYPPITESGYRSGVEL